MSWSVGNGESIRVWQDPWLSTDAPTLPIGPPPLGAQNLMVNDLLCKVSNSWEIDKIRRYRPFHEESILKIITSAGPATDHPSWLFEKSGDYTTRSGYGVWMSKDT